MKPTGTVALVAAREIRERTRAKSFVVSTAITVLVIVAAVLVPNLLSDEERTYRIAVVGALSGPVRQAIEGAGPAVGAMVEVRQEASQDAALAGLEDESVDLVVSPERLVVKEPVEPDDTSERARLAAAISSAVGVQLGLERAGVAPGVAQEALATPPLAVDALRPATPERSAERIAAFYVSLLLYIFIASYGYWILNGVVEEKSSRVVEVLLATMRPRQLLVGKVLGIGAVALANAALLLVAAVGTALAIGSDFLKETTVSLLLVSFMWFVLGYAFYATLYAAAGSLFNRQEEAQNASFPVLLPLVIAYVFSFSPLQNNADNGVLTFLSFFPPTAPISMPARIAIGTASPVEVVIAVALELVAIVVIANVAAKVYAGAVLGTGTRIKARQAFRARSSDA